MKPSPPKHTLTHMETNSTGAACQDQPPSSSGPNVGHASQMQAASGQTWARDEWAMDDVEMSIEARSELQVTTTRGHEAGSNSSATGRNSSRTQRGEDQASKAKQAHASLHHGPASRPQAGTGARRRRSRTACKGLRRRQTHIRETPTALANGFWPSEKCENWSKRVPRKTRSWSVNGPSGAVIWTIKWRRPGKISGLSEPPRGQAGCNSLRAMNGEQNMRRCYGGSTVRISKPPRTPTERTGAAHKLSWQPILEEQMMPPFTSWRSTSDACPPTNKGGYTTR